MTGARPEAVRPSPVECETRCARSDGEEVEARGRVHALYREHSPKLVRQLTRRIGCGEIARELTNETFVRLLRMPPAMLSRIKQPEAYLRRVSTNLVRDWGRSRSVAERSQPGLEQRSDQFHDQVALLETRETLRRVEQALAAMKPKTRDIFLAHRLHGLSYAEIAERTGLTVKGVEKQMSKAIAKIDHVLDRG